MLNSYYFKDVIKDHSFMLMHKKGTYRIVKKGFYYTGLVIVVQVFPPLFYKDMP